jgi:uncharacterized spore protein YtfJ
MMEELTKTIDNLTESFQGRLQARTVFGEPVSSNGITIVPVADVRFGFGGGGGSGSGTESAADGEPKVGSGSGGGGGGGGKVTPLGYIEITDGGSRWVPVAPSPGEIALRGLLAAAALVPGGGRRGFLARVALVIGGQAAISALMRPRVDLPKGLRFGPDAE